MIINEVSLSDSKERFDQMMATGFALEYPKSNPDICFLANEMRHIQNGQINDKTPYQIDLFYGRRLFEILSSFSWFTWDIATNRGFWRYLALFTMPECIFDRFKTEEAAVELNTTALAQHFYAKPERVYPFTLYWIYKIADQGTSDKTYDFLSKSCFSTDTILNVVERMGPKGFRLDIYRKLLERFSVLDFNLYSKKIGAPNLVLRALLVEHGIKNSVYIPELYPGGIDGYVDKVFQATLGETNV